MAFVMQAKDRLPVSTRGCVKNISGHSLFLNVFVPEYEKSCIFALP
jgi:hypothetical protein